MARYSALSFLAPLAWSTYSRPSENPPGVTHEIRASVSAAWRAKGSAFPDGGEAVLEALITELASIEDPRCEWKVEHRLRNRAADPRFPDDACAAVAQVAQFQPVARSGVLQKVVRDPEGYDIPQVAGARSPEARRRLLEALRLAREPLRSPDPTRGALYFVDPALMDAGRCPWFAALRRTARIGGHVFLAEYRPGEARDGPALDCDAAEGGRPAVPRGRPVVATAAGP